MWTVSIPIIPKLHYPNNYWCTVTTPYWISGKSVTTFGHTTSGHCEQTLHPQYVFNHVLKCQGRIKTVTAPALSPGIRSFIQPDWLTLIDTFHDVAWRSCYSTFHHPSISTAHEWPEDDYSYSTSDMRQQLIPTRNIQNLFPISIAMPL
jgi:hypothetical protein